MLTNKIEIEVRNLTNSKPTEPWDIKICKPSPLAPPPSIMLDAACNQYRFTALYKIWFHEQLSCNDNTPFNLALSELIKAYERYGKVYLFGHFKCSPNFGNVIVNYLKEVTQ